MISRGGFELNEMWHKQVMCLEMDQRLRDLERAASRGAPDDVEAYHRALIQAGRSGDVMAHHVREHAKAVHAYGAAREKNEPVDEPWRQMARTRDTLLTHYGAHGDVPADHAVREKNETPRSFGNRLVDMSMATGTNRPGGASEHDHGTVSFEKHHTAEKKDEHYRLRDAVVNAWHREVPEGHATFGDRRGSDYLKGSYASFRTGPKDSR